MLDHGPSTPRNPVVAYGCTGDSVKKHAVFELGSPLESWSALFRDSQVIAEVGRLQAPVHPGEFPGQADTQDDRIGIPTREVLFRDGRSWYFDDSGCLVGAEDVPLMIIYRRDAVHWLQHIEGWYGSVKRAGIDLQYDAEGRVISARSTNGQTVQYAYTAGGELESVGRAAGSVRYAYRNGFGLRVDRAGRLDREFEYTDQGQLRREKRTDGEIAYDVTQTPQGTQITATPTGSGRAETARYDAALRPLHQVLADGTQVDWTYRTSGEVEVVTASPDGYRFAVSRAADRRQQAWTLPEGGSTEPELDPAGRVAQFFQGNRPARASMIATVCCVQPSWNRPNCSPLTGMME